MPAAARARTRRTMIADIQIIWIGCSLLRGVDQPIGCSLPRGVDQRVIVGEMPALLKMQFYWQFAVTAAHIQTSLCFASHDFAARLAARAVPRKAEWNKKVAASVLGLSIKTLTTISTFDWFSLCEYGYSSGDRRFAFRTLECMGLGQTADDAAR